MAVDIVHEVWQELKRHISTADRSEAADSLVSLLIDNDFDAEDIKQSFKGDSDVKRALSDYLKEDEDLEEDQEDDYDDEY